MELAVAVLAPACSVIVARLWRSSQHEREGINYYTCCQDQGNEKKEAVLAAFSQLKGEIHELNETSAKLKRIYAMQGILISIGGVSIAASLSLLSVKLQGVPFSPRLYAAIPVTTLSLLIWDYRRASSSGKGVPVVRPCLEFVARYGITLGSLLFALTRTPTLAPRQAIFIWGTTGSGALLSLWCSRAKGLSAQEVREREEFDKIAPVYDFLVALEHALEPARPGEAPRPLDPEMRLAPPYDFFTLKETIQQKRNYLRSIGCSSAVNEAELRREYRLQKPALDRLDRSAQVVMERALGANLAELDHLFTTVRRSIETLSHKSAIKDFQPVVSSHTGAPAIALRPGTLKGLEVAINAQEERWNVLHQELLGRQSDPAKFGESRLKLGSYALLWLEKVAKVPAPGEDETLAGPLYRELRKWELAIGGEGTREMSGKMADWRQLEGLFNRLAEAKALVLAHPPSEGVPAWWGELDRLEKKRAELAPWVTLLFIEKYEVRKKELVLQAGLSMKSFLHNDLGRILIAKQRCEAMVFACLNEVDQGAAIEFLEGRWKVCVKDYLTHWQGELGEKLGKLQRRVAEYQRDLTSASKDPKTVSIFRRARKCQLPGAVGILAAGDKLLDEMARVWEGLNRACVQGERDTPELSGVWRAAEQGLEESRVKIFAMVDGNGLALTLDDKKEVLRRRAAKEPVVTEEERKRDRSAV